MATSTDYIPIDISLKSGDYTLRYQHFIGNSKAAAKRAKELRTEFPKPTYIVRRIYCNVTVYMRMELLKYQQTS